jgi:hypothetical protein
MQLSPQQTSEKLTLLDTYVISTVLTIVGIRLFLELTGYPQIGGNGLHIAHMLWGGIAMAVATLLLLLIDKPNKSLVAVIAGAGFGFFIDEIGKFVTSDNNYFFRPTAFLVYISIVTLWLVARILIVRRGGGRFLSEAEWPRHRLLRALILGWAFVNMITGYISALSKVFGGANILGFTNEFSDVLPILLIATSTVLLLGLRAYRKGDLHQSAKNIRGATLLLVVTVYPYIFYGEQFSAALGCILATLVIIGLSEVTIGSLLRPIFAIFRRSRPIEKPSL